MSGTSMACEVCGNTIYPHFHSEVAQALHEVTVNVNVTLGSENPDSGKQE